MNLDLTQPIISITRTQEHGEDEVHINIVLPDKQQVRVALTPAAFGDAISGHGRVNAKVIRWRTTKSNQ